MKKTAKKRVRPTKRKSSVTFKPLAESLAAPSNSRPQYDLRTFQKVLEASVWTYASVYRLSTTLASVKLRFVKTGTEEESTSQKLEAVKTLLRRVNPEDTWFDFAMACFVHLSIDGEVYIEKARNKLGQVAELYVLNPEWVEVVPDRAGRRRASSYKLQIGPQVVELPWEDVIPIRNYHPGNTWRGLSPLAGVRRDVAGDIEAALYNLRLLQQGLRPGGMISPKEGEIIDDVQLTRLQADIRKANAGSGNAGNLLVLPIGMDFTRDSVTPREADFLGYRKFSREAVAAAFGVAPMMIQNFDSATYANSEQQLRAFWEHTGKPGLLKLFGALDERLIHEEFDEEISLVYDLVGIEAQIDSEKARVENTTKLLTGGVIMINEARRKMGFPPVPDGDKFLVQGALIPMSPDDIINPLAAAQPDQEREDRESDPREGSDEMNETAALRSFHRNGTHRNGVRRKLRTPEQDDVMRKAHESALIEAEERFGRRVEGSLLQLRRQVGKQLAELGDAATADLLLPSPEKTATGLLEELAPALLEVIRESGERSLRRLGLQTDQQLTWRPRLDAWHQKADAKVTVNFGLGNGRIAEHLRRHFFGHLVDLTQRARTSLEREIVQAHERGEGVSEIADRVARLPEFGAARAEVIARTETIGAINLGAQEAFAAAGTPRKSWLAVGDDRTRTSHLNAETETSKEPIAMSSRFVLEEPGRGHAEVMFPGDPSAPGWASINCFLPGTLVEGRLMGALKASYAGPAREIHTARGHRLRVTPNHPVLTLRGWLRSRDLRKGDDLVSQRLDVHDLGPSPRLCDVENQNGPSRIEDVFQTIARDRGVSPSVVGALDLHGDALFAEREIGVVGTYRLLMGYPETSLADGIGNSKFVTTDACHSSRERGGPFGNGGKRISRPAPGSPSRTELARDGASVATLPLEALRLGATADLDAEADESAKQRAAHDPALVADLLQTGPALVSLDQILEVRDFDWSGHVYDVQDERGWILASGIVSSNCRCTLAPEGDQERAYFADVCKKELVLQEAMR